MLGKEELKMLKILSYAFVGLFLIFMFLPVCAYAVDPEGLVLYYTFDTEDGKTITDLSGNGNNATIGGNPKWVAGVRGEALEFNTQGDELTVPDSDSLKPDVITIALWVNWTGDLLPAKPIQKYTYEAGGFVFKMENAETNMWIYDVDAGAHMYRAIPLPVPGEWTHLAATFDGEFQRGYVNGVVSRQDGGPDMAWNGPIGHVAVPLIIGAHSGDTYTGMIDEVAIYNRALSEEEILESIEKGHGVIAVRPLDKLTTCWARTKLAGTH
jgi:hypothetical protein